MTFYKNLIFDSLPLDELVSVISLPNLINDDWGFVGKLEKLVQLKIFELLKYKTSGYENILLVYIPPKSSIMIHTDYRKNIPEELQVKQTLFIPLKNCDKLIWNWWSVSDLTKVFEQEVKDRFNSVPHVHEKDATKLHSVYCNYPFVANVKQWHNLVNTGNDYAIGISFRFFPWSSCQDFSHPLENKNNGS
jgi:hypothetical protein